MYRINKCKTQVSAALAAFFITLVVCYPQQVHSHYNLRVEIIVKADDELDGIIRSYLTRSLREIKDVSITDVDPDYKIECVASGYQNKSYSPGCVMSISVSGNTDMLLTVNDVAARDESIGKDLYTMLKSEYTLVDLYVLKTSRDDLQRSCSEFIATFDDKHLGLENSFFIGAIHWSLNKFLHLEETP